MSVCQSQTLRLSLWLAVWLSLCPCLYLYQSCVYFCVRVSCCDLCLLTCLLVNFCHPLVSSVFPFSSKILSLYLVSQCVFTISYIRLMTATPCPLAANLCTLIKDGCWNNQPTRMRLSRVHTSTKTWQSPLTRSGLIQNQDSNEIDEAMHPPSGVKCLYNSQRPVTRLWCVKFQHFIVIFT